MSQMTDGQYLSGLRSAFEVLSYVPLGAAKPSADALGEVLGWIQERIEHYEQAGRKTDVAQVVVSTCQRKGLTHEEGLIISAAVEGALRNYELRQV